MKQLRIVAALACALAACGLASAQIWSDNFDSYAAGSNLHGQGGWLGWYGDPGAGALVSNAQSLSAPNSAAIGAGSDLVHEYTGANSGVWTYTANLYMPSGRTGITYFIMLNTYSNDGDPNNEDWSIQLPMTAAGVVTDDMRTETPRTLNLNAWNEIRVVADLTANSVNTYINNQLLSTGTWTTSGSSALNIAAVDLFANNSSNVFYDNLSLVPEPVSGMLLALGLALIRRR